MALEIAVCGIAEIERTAAQFRPTHAVTLLDPATPRPRIADVEPSAHLFIGVHDVARPAPDQEHPQDHHVETILAFGESLRPAIVTSDVRLLIHCWAGVSRSTAAAFCLKCQLTELSEPDALYYVHRVRSQMWPNELIVSLADTALARRGRMLHALMDWRRGQDMPAGYSAWLRES